MTNFIYQVFKGKTVFCVVEYIFGVPQQNQVYPISDYPHIINKMPQHARSLIPVCCSDNLVKSVSKSTQNAYVNINLNR